MYYIHDVVHLYCPTFARLYIRHVSRLQVMRKRSPSPELTMPQNENTSLTMLTIPEGARAADEMEPDKVKEEKGEVRKEKGLKRQISR